MRGRFSCCCEAVENRDGRFNGFGDAGGGGDDIFSSSSSFEIVVRSIG